MDGALTRYDAACAAVAAAKSVDEVRGIIDKVAAVREYARRAKNRQLEVDAAEIRMRAERRYGELLTEMKDSGQLLSGRPSKKTVDPERPLLRVTLTDIGASKDFSSRCQKLAAVPAAKFEGLIDDWRERVGKENERVSISLLAEGDKAERRAAREAELGARQRALPNKEYGVILCDPEWRYEPWSRDTGLDRAADNHYPTSSLAALCARDVAAIAAKDCLLALWAIVPMLAEAFVVLDAYGFARFDRDPDTGFLTIDKSQGRYVSSATWMKYKPGAGIGLGHWFRVDHEILLIATRGHVPAPDKGTQPRSVFDVPASEVHSEKPELVCEILEAYFPTLPKIELNRRGAARPGWDAWGNEAEPPFAEAAE